MIHIELVEDKSTTAFVQTLIRFTNTNGVPAYIYSTNARSFDVALRGDMVEHHIQTSEFGKKFNSYRIKLFKNHWTHQHVGMLDTGGEGMFIQKHWLSPNQIL